MTESNEKTVQQLTTAQSQMKTKFMQHLMTGARKNATARYALPAVVFTYIFFRDLYRYITRDRRRSRRFGWGLVSCMVIFLTFGIHAIATTPRAQIVGFADRATGGLRLSELCEVETSGFAKDATLTYSYTFSSSKSWRVWVYSTSNMNSTSYHIMKAGTSFTAEGMKYFTVEGHTPYNCSVTVTVTDGVNSASCSYSGFNQSNIVADLQAGTYGLFVEESTKLRTIYGEGGVPGSTVCWTKIPSMSIIQGSTENMSYNQFHYHLDLFWPFPDVDYYDYDLVGLKSGIVCINAHIDVEKDCVFHCGESGDVQTFIGIFPKPQIQNTLHTITVYGDTKAGLTYTINNESIRCDTDGEKMIFGTKSPLVPATEYELTLMWPINGKNVVKRMTVQTSDTCYVQFDTGNKSTTPQNLDKYQGTVKYNSSLSAYDNYKAPATTGYDFKGWYDNASYSGSNYVDTPITVENVNMYAKWVPKTYTVKAMVRLDGNAYPGASVTLCQNGKAQYKLNDISASDGAEVYSLPNVAYSEYGSENGKNFSYDIYINGKDSGLKCFLNGDAASGTEQDITMYCSTIYVNLTKDGASWNGQKVVIDNNTAQYQMENSGGKYSYLQAYDTASPANVHSFEIYVNDVLIRDWTDSNMTAKESTVIPVNRADQANGTDISFYSVTVTLKKNDAFWKGAKVTLLQNGTVMETPVDAGNGTYNVCVFSKYPYDLYVAEVYTGEDTGIDVNGSNKAPSVNYYTADFVDGENIADAYYQQIIQNTEKNGRAGKPVAPYKEGKTFMGWFDAQDDGNQFFLSGNTTAPITAQTTLYAHWLVPELIIGDYVKCNASGVQDGSASAAYYRLANLSITGYPKATGDTPMRTAVVYIDKEDTFCILGNTVVAAGNSGSGTYTYSGSTLSYTYKYTQGTENEFEFFLNGGDGWTVDQTQSFLNSQIFVKPNATSTVEEHHCKVKVFGTTATKN